MIIKDLNAQEYNVTKTRIYELPLIKLSRYVIFSELRDAWGSGDTPVRYRGDARENGPTYLGDYGPDSLGCRTFSPATFAKILKAAGVKVARKKKK